MKWRSKDQSKIQHFRSIEEERCVQVFVRDTNIDQALKVLKKKMQREGVSREMKLGGHYEKPSESARLLW